MNILLVEPDVPLARVYQQALQADGHTVDVAATAQAAIHAADTRMPDVVLLEMQLVSHSGVEFLYEFRSYTDWQKIPVVVLSVVPHTEFNGSQQLLKQELGVVDYYYKPHVTLKQLTSLVARAVTVHSS